MIDQARRSRLLQALLVPLVVLAWLAVVLVVTWLLSHVTRAVLILVLGTLVGFALTPLVNFLQRWMPRIAAIAVSYVLAFAFVLGMLTLIGVTAVTEITNLSHNLPDYAARARDLEPQILRVLSPLGVTLDQLRDVEARILAYMEGIVTQTAADVLGLITSVLNAVVDAVLVLILSIYLVANGPRLVLWLREQAPRSQRRRANLLIAIVNQVVGGYIRGTLTLALLVGVLVGGGMALLGVRYALLLGILAFFMEFVPVLGVLISGGVCVVVALFQGWVLALIVLGYFVVVHVIEGDLVGPRIMGRAVGVHPAVALLALVAGSELFGLWGALFGAAIAGLLQAIATAAWREAKLSAVEEATEPEVVEAAVEAERRPEEARPYIPR